MAQQTAVEFLIESIDADARGLWTKELRKKAEQAKQMEREQMEKAYKQPLFSDCQTFDQYYNKTYGNNQNN